MPRTKADSKVNSDDYFFKIKAEKQDCYYNDPIKVKFCLENGKSATKKQNMTFQGPIFNKDKVTTTPAFILKSDQDKFKKSSAFLSNQNPEKYFNVAEQKSEMLIPKPSSKSFFCNVCKQKYVDYMQHIKSEKHKNKIQNNPFNRHIHKLASSYEKNRTLKQKQKQLNLQTLSQLPSLIVIDNDSFNEKMLSNPRKLLKMQKNVQEKQPEVLNAQNAQPFPLFNCFQPPSQALNQERFQYFLNSFYTINTEGPFYTIQPLMNLMDPSRFYPMDMMCNPFRFMNPWPQPCFQVPRQSSDKAINKSQCIIIDDN